MAKMQVDQGFAGSWNAIIKDSTGAVITSYNGSEPLTGVVSAGEDIAAAVSLTVQWVNAAQGMINVAISSVNSAALSPGTYQVKAYPTDKSACFYRGQLVVIPSAGSASAPFSYISYLQLLTYAGQADRLLDAIVDEAQFSLQRHQASIDFDRLVLNRYNPQPGRSRRFMNSAGTGAGSYPVFAPGPANADAPTVATIGGYLGTAAVVMNADTIETVARMALSIIYMGQPGTDNVYRESGKNERSLAEQAFRRCLVEIDTNSDGHPELRIDQDVTWLT